MGNKLIPPPRSYILIFPHSNERVYEKLKHLKLSTDIKNVISRYYYKFLFNDVMKEFKVWVERVEYMRLKELKRR
jgi:hypothetical protein